MPDSDTDSDDSDSEYTSIDDPDIGLPGCGLPLDHNPDTLFKSALSLNDDGEPAALPLIALRELTMLRLMDQFSDKADWDENVFDETIVSKWKAEALETGVDVTQKMVDWCIEELRYKAGIFQKTGAISIYTGDVVKSDTILPTALRNALKTAATPLEDKFDMVKDWRPGSDRKILDLVDPSFFPLVYGRTQILTDGLTTLRDFIDQCGNGRVSATPDEETEFFHPWNEFSCKFQWLPCEVNISQEHVRIVSYINNLNPQKYRDLYQVIEQIISHAIPMWDMTLTPLKVEEYRYTRLTYSGCEYDLNPVPQVEDNYWDQQADWIWPSLELNRRRSGNNTQPDAGEFQLPSMPMEMWDGYLDFRTRELSREHVVDLRRDFWRKGLQVIVKLTNIHLTPDKPEYEGGTWHIEGRLNEHICATALYCYDSVNVTKNCLAFRQRCTCPEISGGIDEQHERDLLNNIFGVNPGEPAIQEIGSVEMREGRLITFPNIFQRRVQPFSLADPSKPGHCKVLALYLVDPHIRIISTANIPCQRRDWWREKIVQGGPRRLVNLPLELQDSIFEQVGDFPIGMEEARKFRLELTQERHTYANIQSEAFASNRFSLNDPIGLY
ncbi:hypothetical protein BD779DRAFT_658289 [Infundibulicybe gibba]|nr:hypothetical protein BD779DRAFT_658289 [Infundibulicybe gibba]